MLIVTTETIEGKRLEMLGTVKGSTIQTVNAFKDIGSGLKTLVGGELGNYNKMMVKAFLEENVKTWKLIPSEATYLLWIDCSETGMTGEELSKKLKKETGVYLTAGSEYGESGKYFLRMNIACPRKTLEEAVFRIKNKLKVNVCL